MRPSAWGYQKTPTDIDARPALYYGESEHKCAAIRERRWKRKERMTVHQKEKSATNLRIPSKDDIFRLFDAFKANPGYETAIPFYSAMKHLERIDGLSSAEKIRLTKASSRAVEILGSFAVAISA